MLAYISHNHQTQQSLAAHSHSVASLCAHFAGKLGLESIGFMIGVLHDGGKARGVYQNYLLHNAPASGEKIDHSTFGARLVHELSISNPSPYHPLLNQLAAVAICSHHGGLIDCLTPDGQAQYEKRISPDTELDYKECMDNFFKECISSEDLSALYDKSLFEICNLWERVRPTGYFGIGMLQKFLASCLIDADRYDTYCLEAEKAPERRKPLQWHLACARIDKYLERLPKDTPLDRLRGNISEDCKKFAANQPGIYHLFVPPGGGKTLSALRYALYHCDEYEKDHLYYITPSHSVVDQISILVRKVLGLSPEDPIVSEYCVDAITDDFLEETELQQQELLSERWNTPIIITPMQQLLETLFGKNLRRFHQLANSVIIFDEFQSLPIKCIHLFNAAINFLTQVCNTTILLCSSTVSQLSENMLFPILPPFPSKIVPDLSLKFRKLKRTKTIDRTTPEGYNCEELCRFILDRTLEHTSVLVILNTRHAVQTIYKQLKERTTLPVFLLSPNLCRQNRRFMVEQLRMLPAGTKTVCVSSPLIESGIDISFDCVIRSLAGVDHIAHASGLCNRNGTSRQFSPTYLVTLNHQLECPEHLKEIQRGQKITRRMLSELSSGTGEADLLSSKMLQQYYTYYYNGQNDEMDYPIENTFKNSPEKSFTLYELLGKNQKAITAYYHQNTRLLSFVFFQSFHTATERFQVWSGSMVSILTPYQEGKNIIAALHKNLSFRQKTALLQKCRPYLIVVFHSELDRLLKQGLVYWLEDPGVYIARESSYIEGLGTY